MRLSLCIALCSLVSACTRCPAPGVPGAPAHGASAANRVTAPPAAWPHFDERYLEAAAATQSFRLGRPVPLAATADGAVLFRRTPSRDRRADLYELTPKGDVVLLASAASLLSGAKEALTDAERARRERTRTMTAGVVDIDVSRDGRVVLVPLGGRLFVIDRGRHGTRELAVGQGAPFDPRLSPDGRTVAFARDGDLWVTPVEGGAPRRLVRHEEGTELATAEFVAQEEFGRSHGFWWSPDSRRIAFQSTDARKVETVFVSDPAHPEKAPVPFKFPHPGQDNAVVKLGVVPLTGGKPVWADWDAALHPYVAKVSWTLGAPLALVVLDRNQTEEELLRVDPATGKTTSLVVERDAAWLDLAPGSPSFFEDGSGFLWMQLGERGYSLERYDADGRHVATVLPDAFGVRQIAGIEPGGRSVIVEGATDPRVQHVFRVPLDGGAPSPLTSGGGVHRATAEHGVTVVTSSVGAEGPTVTAIAANGARAALPSAVEKPPWEPTTVLESVELPGRTLYTAITRPHAFDPSRRYPVLVRVYGGPGVKTVTDASAGYLADQWYADAGFIVVRADGRGTPDHGRAFERAILHDFVTAPLEDQVAALRTLQGRHPEMDPARTGIFGWSFGGYLSLMAVLLRPDVFHAAIAGAPVTDWELYDTAYTERYLKVPEDDREGYDRSSALLAAERLCRPLLLIHGINDDNVHFAHSLRFIEALHAAGKRAEVIALSSTHMVPEPRVFALRELAQLDFFRKYLSYGGTLVRLRRTASPGFRLRGPWLATAP